MRRSLLARILDTDDEKIVAFYRRVGIYGPLDRLARALGRFLRRFTRS